MDAQAPNRLTHTGNRSRPPYPPTPPAAATTSSKPGAPKTPLDTAHSLMDADMGA